MCFFVSVSGEEDPLYQSQLLPALGGTSTGHSLLRTAGGGGLKTEDSDGGGERHKNSETSL